ncbi:Gpr1 family protein [Mycena sanguinolenta]|uniref:Gpr1 family protein n=1 Tax=Mycena sanguinolenta TaxID=230812 RepID=A0A8H6X9B4_9AGAR|nr:Gpr1 family protein [Mycena sanguinolenta]
MSLVLADLVTIVIDDTVLLSGSFGDINIGNTGAWLTTDSDAIDAGFPSNYNNTNFNLQSTPFGEGAWVFQFDGTAVALFGITPPAQFNQTFGIGDPPFHKVNITNPKDYSARSYPSPSQGGSFYTSSILPNASQIQVGITGARGLAIDYALVGVGPSTDLQSQTILVDDSSSEIIWNGSWTIQANYTLPVPCQLAFSSNSDDGFSTFTANMSPHGNSSHFSNEVGDSFTFSFAGTSLLVSGVTPGDDMGQDWLLQMQFTIDENVTTSNFTRDPNYISKPHFEYFKSDPLKPGNHTFTAKIVNAVGSVVPGANIDYITYKPSFLTIQDKPNFGPVPNGISTQSQSASNPSGTFHSSTPSSNGKEKDHPTAGPVAGGVVGGILVILLLVLSWRWWKKRHRERKAPLRTDPFTVQPTQAPGVEINVSQAKGVRLPLVSSTSFSTFGGRPVQNAAQVDSTVHQSPEVSDVHPRTNVDARGNALLEHDIRALQSQMQEIRAHIIPPSYDGEN